MTDNPMAAAPPAPADRAAELRGVANYLHDRGTDLVDGGLTAAADLLRRMADEAQQPEAQAWPLETSWKIETQWHNGGWRSWALRSEHDDALREFAAVEDGTHAWRLVRFDTTTTVEAEHAVPQPGKEA